MRTFGTLTFTKGNGVCDVSAQCSGQFVSEVKGCRSVKGEQSNKHHAPSSKQQLQRRMQVQRDPGKVEKDVRKTTEQVQAQRRTIATAPNIFIE